MTFTDDDLKRLKNDLEDSEDWESFNFFCDMTPKHIQALIARLEAAEHLAFVKIHPLHTYPEGTEDQCKIAKAIRAWQKATGK